MTKNQLFVFIQVVIMGAYVAPIVSPKVGPSYLLGLFLLILGIVILIWSFLSLGSNLSPFPAPKQQHELITHGLYKIVRHPIYLGVLLLMFGGAMYWQDAHKWITSIAIAILFHYKSAYEESLLVERYQEAYVDYQNRVGKLIPKWKSSR